jgi:hypothetical protein
VSIWKKVSVWSLILILGFGGIACFGDDDPTDPDEDTTAPAAVDDLIVVEAATTHTSMTLNWTAPGDDGNTGTATTYDIRYMERSRSYDWETAVTVSGEPSPGAAGTAESFTINNLDEATEYTWALKTADEVPNWSGMSNTAVDTTLGSLIVTTAQAGWYSIVDANTGEDLAHVQAAGLQLRGEPSLGYQSRTLFILSPTGPGGANVAIYKCDPFTGPPFTAITNDDDLSVKQLDGSPVSPSIVFSAEDTDTWVQHIYTMGYDRDTPVQLSTTDEMITIPGVGSARILSATKPSWSPDGSKIAFVGYLRSIEPILAYNAVFVMDPTGANKEVIYVQQLEEAHYDTPCWTADGNYVAFMEQNPTNTGVMFVSMSSGTAYNLWDDLDAAAYAPDMLTMDPWHMRVCVYYNYPSGSNIWIADLITAGDAISASTPVALTDQSGTGHAYGWPDWAPWSPIFD